MEEERGRREGGKDKWTGGRQEERGKEANRRGR